MGDYNLLFQPAIERFHHQALTVLCCCGRWDGSYTCGQCLEFAGTGSGLGATPLPTSPEYAMVTNECPGGCQSAGPGNQLDIEQNGDGQWGITWSVQLPPNRDSPVHIDGFSAAAGAFVLVHRSPCVRQSKPDLPLFNCRHPVQCNTGDASFQYSWQGSNANYLKMQISNTRWGALTCLALSPLFSATGSQARSGSL